MSVLPLLIAAAVALAAVSAAGHALLYKRDPRSAFGWIAVCLMFPVAGPLLYFLFGINRVRTRARELSQRSPFRLREGAGLGPALAEVVAAGAGPGALEGYEALVRLSDGVSRRPLVGRNRVQALHGGEQAYPAMLEAIARARDHLYLATYILDTDATGRELVQALTAAQRRGVDVRVLLDGVGQWYSWPLASRLLRRQGVPTATFLPPRLLPPSLHVNLRNHRKILVADGRVGFAGGMNIGERHLVERTSNRRRVADIHFRFSGPVVSELEEIFLEDWGFVTGEYGAPAAPQPDPEGAAVCRAISDGPNEDLDKLESILVGAISAARRRLCIMTPYFVPGRELISVLNAAALRGVRTTVVLPERSNLPVVHWATRNLLWQLLNRGVEIYYQPPPFVHSKLLLVDEGYALVGSANIDPRSLRLNFELAVEVFDASVVGDLLGHVDAVIGRSRAVTLQEVDSRALPVRLRDSVAWLFSPYL